MIRQFNKTDIENFPFNIGKTFNETLPLNANNNDGVTIKFQNYGNSNGYDDLCYFKDISLYGMEATPVPTISPIIIDNHGKQNSHSPSTNALFIFAILLVLSILLMCICCVFYKVIHLRKQNIQDDALNETLMSNTDTINSLNSKNSIPLSNYVSTPGNIPTKGNRQQMNLIFDTRKASQTTELSQFSEGDKASNISSMNEGNIKTHGYTPKDNNIVT